jgi:hypothetical protein
VRPPAGRGALARDLGRHALREAERESGEVLVVGVRDLERALERVLHLAVEPALDELPRKTCATTKSSVAGKSAIRTKARDEAGAEMRAEDAAPALEDQLGDVPARQEDEQDEEDEVQVDERDEDDVEAGECSRTAAASPRRARSRRPRARWRE